MSGALRTYLPAAGHDWMLPLYDPIVKLLGGESARRVLIDQAELQPGHRVLEIGCGTGTLLMQIKRAHNDVDVTGLDPDPKALDRTRRKAKAAAVAIRLDRDFSDSLPYPDASFDRVFSSFMFHHLETVDEKRNTLREVHRVLEPGGRLHLLDFDRPDAARGAITWLHSTRRLEDNTEARILSLMREAGLVEARVVGRAKLFLLSRIAYLQSERAA